MKDTVKKSTKKDKILGQLIMLLVTFAISIGVGVILPKFIDKDSVHGEMEIDSGWDAYASGMHYEDIAISSTRFPMQNKGDILIFENTLPCELPSHPMLVVYSIHSIVTVELDNEVIYEYGEDLASQGKMLGYGYHYISMNDSAAGKKIKITFDITENEAFSTLPVPYIGDGDYLFRDFVINNKGNILILGAIFILGVILAVTALFYMRKDRSMVRLLSVGLFSISIAGWSICNKDIIMLFSYNLYLKTFWEYGFLYLAPFFLFLYFAEEIKHEGKTRVLLYRILMTLQATFSFGSWLLQLTNLVHFPVVLKGCHILLGFGIVFILGRFFVDIFCRRMEVSILLYGFEFLIFFVIYDLAWFNIGKYVSSVDNDHYSGVLYVGVLFLVLSMIIDIAYKYIKGVQETVRKDLLEKMAYTDPMTGLANRRSFESEIDRIANNNYEYALTSFDLNYLKRVNDNYGHDEGDLYLRAFADALTKSYNENAMVARIGGDEFVALITKWDGSDIDSYIENLNREIDRINSEHSKWTMSVAYGSCTSRDIEGNNVKEAVKIADERMYKCKQEMKRNINDDLRE